MRVRVQITLCKCAPEAATKARGIVGAREKKEGALRWLFDTYLASRLSFRSIFGVLGN